MRDYYLGRLKSLKEYLLSIPEKDNFEARLIPKLQVIDSLNNIFNINNMFEKILEDTNANIGKFLYIINNEITFENSKYDLMLMGMAISRCSSDSEVCLQAFTNYKCKLCGNEKTHENSCVPSVCNDCGLKIAYNIIEKGFKFEK